MTGLSWTLPACQVRDEGGDTFLWGIVVELRTTHYCPLRMGKHLFVLIVIHRLTHLLGGSLSQGLWLGLAVKQAVGRRGWGVDVLRKVGGGGLLEGSFEPVKSSGRFGVDSSRGSSVDEDLFDLGNRVKDLHGSTASSVEFDNAVWHTCALAMGRVPSRSGWQVPCKHLTCLSQHLKDVGT